MDNPLALAKTLALEAGDIMLEHFGFDTEHTLKDDRSPLTEADIKINNLVISRLKEAFPDHSFLGEEGQELNESEYVWVFDPIDGTVPFTRGIPTNVFALALVKDGEPILGVVYDPYMKRLFHAVKGEGAFVNEVPLTVSKHATFENAYIKITRQNDLLNNDLYDELRAHNVQLLTFHSSVYAHMLVAAGQIQGAIYPLSKPWDCAASKILIEEAGGVTRSFTGAPQRYDAAIAGFICAANTEILEKLAELAQRSFPLPN